MNKRIVAVISDANIIIDYLSSNKHILSIATEKLCDIYIPTPIFNEISQIDENIAAELGLKIIEPDFKQLTESMERGGALSYQDRICFILARDKEYSCATNDKTLKRHCENNNIKTIWGLEIMILLVEKGHLTKKIAITTAKDINKRNRLITAEVLNSFIEKINEIK